ncbi:MAG: hypothetical protein GTO30_05725, partial [Acidobacteria bacterium]|nr:hypothetical protein [Acidobacteriota bacterium]NIQ84501.1 hypothetical protein [Acidobacteriota bacterium]
ADLETEPSGQTPVSDITTGSVPAYQAYQEGLVAMRSHRWETAQDQFDRALAHDPGFALAHFYRSR